MIYLIELTPCRVPTPLHAVKLHKEYYIYLFIFRRLQQAAGAQESAMTTDNIEHQPLQHPHYHHHHHHLHQHQHHRHHNNNDNDVDKDDDDDDRLSGGGDDYEQLDSDDNSSYASRALRRFTARATAGIHDGATRLRTAVDTDWPSQTVAGTDSHLLYPATSATSIHDDVTFVGKKQHVHSPHLV